MQIGKCVFGLKWAIFQARTMISSQVMDLLKIQPEFPKISISAIFFLGGGVDLYIIRNTKRKMAIPVRMSVIPTSYDQPFSTYRFLKKSAIFAKISHFRIGTKMSQGKTWSPIRVLPISEITFLVRRSARWLANFPCLVLLGLWLTRWLPRYFQIFHLISSHFPPYKHGI